MTLHDPKAEAQVLGVPGVTQDIEAIDAGVALRCADHTLSIIRRRLEHPDRRPEAPGELPGGNEP